MVDTNLKTADDGYEHRKLAKVFDDIRVSHDLTVRDGSDIVQFITGGGVWNVRMLEKHVLTFAKDPELPNELNGLQNMRASVRTNPWIRDYTVWLPVNFDQIDATPVARGSARNYSAVVDAELMESFYKIVVFDWDALPLCRREMFFAMNEYLRAELIFRLRHVKSAAVRALVRTVCARMINSVAAPGESIGIQTAQSIAHEATQTTLNTFHSSGANATGSVLAGGGVRYILEAQKKATNPCIRLAFRGATRRQVKLMKTRVERRTVGEFVECSAIHFGDDPLARDPELRQDMELLGTPFYEPIDASCSVRLVLSRYLLYEHRVRVEDIVVAMRRAISDEHYVIYGDTNTRPGVDIVIVVQVCPDATGVLGVRALMGSIMDLEIRGLCDIVEIVDERDMGLFGNNTSESESFGMVCVGAKRDNAFFRTLRKLAAIDGIRLDMVAMNHLRTLQETYGIEAARACIAWELSTIFQDAQLIMTVAVVADTMTQSGTVCPCTKEGIRMRKGPISRIAFETPFSNLRNACISGTTDDISSNSACVMIGRPSKAGTGFSDILM